MFAKTTFALACLLVIGTATAASAQSRGYGYSEPIYSSGMEGQGYRYRSAPDYGYRYEPAENYYSDAPSYGYWQNPRLINRHTGEQ
jgi:hypothetical protein